MTNSTNQEYDGIIRKYLLVELKMPAQYVENTLDALKKHQDIYLEFCTWLDSRVFPEMGAEVAGYNARKLINIQPQLSGLAAYLLLIGLRDNNKQTLGYIEEGLPMC